VSGSGLARKTRHGALRSVVSSDRPAHSAAAPMRDSTSGSDTAFAFLGSGRDAQNVETARTASSTCVPVFAVPVTNASHRNSPEPAVANSFQSRYTLG
jgi:hypothetical protein